MSAPNNNAAPQKRKIENPVAELVKETTAVKNLIDSIFILKDFLSRYEKLAKSIETGQMKPEFVESTTRTKELAETMLKKLEPLMKEGKLADCGSVPEDMSTDVLHMFNWHLFCARHGLDSKSRQLGLSTNDYKNVDLFNTKTLDAVDRKRVKASPATSVKEDEEEDDEEEGEEEGDDDDEEESTD